MKVTVNYGLTVPGPVEYSSERFSISLEQEVGNEDAEAAIAMLAMDAKLAVINQAGASAATDENGVIRPVLQGRAAATAPAPVVPISQAPSYGQYTPEDGPRFDQPTATAQAEVQAVNALPQNGSGKIDTVWDNRPVTIYDNRAKKASGEYSANAAEFKIKFNDVGPDAPQDVKYKSIWLRKKGTTEITQAGAAIASMFGG